MKNIIILGPSRVGKSSLASLICNKYKNIHYISGDSIRNAFINIYPELGYSVKNAINRKDFCQFINFITNENNIHLKRNVYYVIDSADITIKNAKEVFNNSLVIGIGSKNISNIDMVKNIKENDTKLEWTYGYSDKDLIDICNETIKLSEELEENCKNNNVEYFDTSIDRLKTFEQIIDYIEKEMDMTTND